jgi:hypothetical protein
MPPRRVRDHDVTEAQPAALLLSRSGGGGQLLGHWTAGRADGATHQRQDLGHPQQRRPVDGDGHGQQRDGRGGPSVVPLDGRQGRGRQRRPAGSRGLASARRTPPAGSMGPSRGPAAAASQGPLRAVHETGLHGHGPARRAGNRSPYRSHLRGAEDAGVADRPSARHRRSWPRHHHQLPLDDPAGPGSSPPGGPRLSRRAPRVVA